jgi:DmsE family decaheme c-type cytochrome
MNTRGSIAVLTLLAAIGAALISLAFQGAESSEPSTLTDAVCMDCHEDVAHALLGTAHAMSSKVSCLDCHAGAATEAHVDDPDLLPVNPARLAPDSLTAKCTECHADAHPLNLFERDPHRDAGLACAACHSVHNPGQHIGLLKDAETTLCFSCHAAQKGDFAMPTHHPVLEGVVRCSDCHQSIAQSAKQHVPSGPSETCTRCHAMFEGPFPFEHAAAVDYSTEEGGCLNCHAPHGSPNPRLLKQPYQAPDFALCSQCHSVPKHQNNINHGTQWAGVPCADCHVDVHGSYDNAKLLDPALQAQGCFAVGCHAY